MNSISYECCILGTGPAGIGTALELTKHGVTNILLIDRNSKIGGLSRTELFDNVRFDIGPHRFFTKNKEIDKLWHDTLGTDFRPVSRLTRINYKNKFFNYPIKAFDVLAKLGPIESLHAMISFAYSNVGKRNEPESFEEWIIQKFGQKLYKSFFKTYTEKVWGIPCNRIGAEWAAQRIKGLDVMAVLKNSFISSKNGDIKTLVEEFDYPVLGAGQMYEALCDKLVSRGVQIMLNSEVVSFNRKENDIKSIDIINSDNDEKTSITAKHFFNSIPLTHFFKMLDPLESDEIQKAIDELYYRDHITVQLLVHGQNLFPDQWIYVHTPDVQMARIANYNNFSKAMVGTKDITALSVEYFVFQHEDLWKKSDDQLKTLAIDEIEHLKLIKRSAIEKAWVVRETESYPTYHINYREPYDLVKSKMDQFTNIYQIGRGGMYKYNNQDHSLMSGILAARNYLKIENTPYNLWDINIDGEYHESAERSGILVKV